MDESCYAAVDCSHTLPRERIVTGYCFDCGDQCANEAVEPFEKHAREVAELYVVFNWSLHSKLIIL